MGGVRWGGVVVVVGWGERGVDFSAVQVTNMAQLYSFVLDDRYKPYFTLKGNFRRMEAHSASLSERKSGRSFIEMSFQFLMDLTPFFLYSQRWS